MEFCSKDEFLAQMVSSFMFPFSSWHDQKEIEKTPTPVLPPLSLADPITKKTPTSIVRSHSIRNAAVESSVKKDLRAQNLNFRQRPPSHQVWWRIFVFEMFLLTCFHFFFIVITLKDQHPFCMFLRNSWSRPLLLATFASPLTRPHPRAQCIILSMFKPISNMVWWRFTILVVQQDAGDNSSRDLPTRRSQDRFQRWHSLL